MLSGSLQDIMRLLSGSSAGFVKMPISLSSTSQFRQKAQDLKIKPNKCDNQPKSSLPLHIAGKILFAGSFNKVKVENQIESCDHNHKGTKRNPHRTAGMNKRHINAEKNQDDG